MKQSEIKLERCKVTFLRNISSAKSTSSTYYIIITVVVSSYWQICRYDERHRIRYWHRFSHRSSRNFLACFFVHNHPQDRLELRQSAFTYFAPRPNTLSQTRKFVVQCQRCFQIAELPPFGAHDWRCCWNSEAKWPGRSWEPDLNEGDPWRSQFRLGGLDS